MYKILLLTPLFLPDFSLCPPPPPFPNPLQVNKLPLPHLTNVLQLLTITLCCQSLEKEPQLNMYSLCFYQTWTPTRRWYWNNYNVRTSNHCADLLIFLLIKMAAFSPAVVFSWKMIPSKTQWNLHLTESLGTGQIRSLNRGFVISRFSFIYFTITGAKNTIRYIEVFAK